MSALAVILNLLAFALLGLATAEHHRARFGMAPDRSRVRTMRTVAWLLIAVSFPPAIAAQGWIFGPILWAGTVMFGAGVVFLALQFLPGKASR